MPIREWLAFFPHVDIPKEQFGAFQLKMDQTTLQRGLKVTRAIIVFESVMIALTFLLHRSSTLAPPYRSYFFMYGMMLAVMISYQGLHRIIRKRLEKNRLSTMLIVYLLTGFILGWSAGITLLDLKGNGQHTVYMVAMIVIAVIPLFKPYASLILYLTVHAGFLLALPFFGRTGSVLFGDIINSTIMMVLSWLASRLLYIHQAQFWLDQNTIELQNRKLEAINADFETANRELARISQTDGLTGAFNRFKLEEVLELEWERCKRHKLLLSAIMIDIDFFKQYNDQYGHVEGDSCIRQVAELLNSNVRRSSEIVARFGGDEFVMILPHVDVPEAAGIAESMRMKIENEKIPNRGSPLYGYITISLGTVTCIPDTTHTADDFIHWADMALYESKNNGRNRVSTYSPPLHAG